MVDVHRRRHLDEVLELDVRHHLGVELVLDSDEARDQDVVLGLDQDVVLGLDQDVVPDLDQDAVPDLDQGAVPDLDQGAVLDLDQGVVLALVHHLVHAPVDDMVPVFLLVDDIHRGHRLVRRLEREFHR